MQTLTEKQRRTYLRHACYVLKEEVDRMNLAVQAARESMMRNEPGASMAYSILAHARSKSVAALQQCKSLRSVLLRTRANDLADHFQRLTHAGKCTKVNRLGLLRNRLFQS